MSKEDKVSVLTADDFQPYVDNIFRVKLDDCVLELTLSKCETIPQFNDTRFREPFRLVFLSKDKNTLRQGNYPLHCGSLGILNLFLVPVANSKYEVIFN